MWKGKWFTLVSVRALYSAGLACPSLIEGAGEGMGRESLQSQWVPHAVSRRRPYPLRAPSRSSAYVQAFLETLRVSVERYEETFRVIPRGTA